jgi:hypothetical protein
VLHVRRGAALHGRILAPDGKKQVAGQVEIALIEGGETPGAWAINASKGSFDLKGLGAGTYDLIALGGVAQVCSARVELATGEQRELELKLQPGATLCDRERRAQDLLVELRAEGRFIGSHLLSKATRLKLVVPPAALELRFLDAEKHRLATQTVTLRAGEERTLAYPAALSLAASVLRAARCARARARHRSRSPTRASPRRATGRGSDPARGPS